MSYIEALTLNNFRNYESASLKGLHEGFIVLSGDNGAGKTNCLEAVSLLTPGKGIRGASLDAYRIASQSERKAASNAGGLSSDVVPGVSPARWSIFSSINSDTGTYKIGTGEDVSGRKRVAKINGEKIRALSALSEHLACIWFTPNMSGLFLGGASDRRRFFDRLVFAFDPAHAGRLRRYEQALYQRSKILKDAHQKGMRPDATWLDGLEISMAETGVSLAASRLELLSLLQEFCEDFAQEGFPSAQMRLVGGIEGALVSRSALSVEDELKELLRASRSRDAVAGGAQHGAHRTDLRVVYQEKYMEAAQCSTGEQKALLMGIILSHARFIAARRGEVPLLLLDEIAAHFDPDRRAVLFDILQQMKGQVWLSGTEKSLFDELPDGQFIHVENGLLKQA